MRGEGDGARTLGMVPWALEVENVRAESYRDTRGPAQNGFICLLDQTGKRNDWKAVRDCAILRLLHDLALRCGKVTNLDLEDVDLDAGSVAVLGKVRTQKETMSLPEPTKAALAGWVSVRENEPGPLFVNYDHAGKGQGRLTGTGLYYVVRGLGEKTGRKVRPHGLRHTAITEACKAAQAHGM